MEPKGFTTLISVLDDTDRDTESRKLGFVIVTDPGFLGYSRLVYPSTLV